MFPHITVFGKTISVYGLMLILAYVTVFIFSMVLARCKKLDTKHAINFTVFGVFGVIIGSKLLFFVTDGISNVQLLLAYNPDASIWRIIQSSFGGFRFLGGVALALFLIWLYTRFANIPFYTYSILVMIPAPLAIAFFRLGCFSAGCCYGSETSSIFGIHFPDMAEDLRVLPLQLFESGAYFLFFIVQLILLKKSVPNRLHHHVAVFGFAITRFITEYFRPDATWLLPFLSVTQLLCVLAIVYIIFLEIANNKYTTKNEEIALSKA